MILPLLLSLFLVRDVNGECACDPNLANQTYDRYSWPTFYLQSTADGNKPCVPSKPCEMLLYSGSPTLGIGLYNQHVWDASAAGCIYFYESDESGKQGDSLVDGFPCISRDAPRAPRTSTGSYVLAVMNLTGAGQVLVTLDVTAPATTGAPVTTAVPPTTTIPYNGPFTANPALISNDLLIMVDQGQNFPNTVTDFQNSKTFATNVINKLAASVVPGYASNSPVTGTRLSLNYLNYINNGAAVAPWIDNSTAVNTQITALLYMQSAKTNFYKALNPLVSTSADVSSIFNPKNTAGDAPLNSRNTAQRVLLIVASSPPETKDVTAIADISFTTYDIHPIFVAYNFTDISSLAPLLVKGWQIESVTNYSDSTVGNFIEKYFLKNNDAGTPLCGISNPEDTAFNADDKKSISYGFDASILDASPFYSPNYQKSRYCNFQKIRYTVKKSQTVNIGYCFKIFYELEVEKDTLKFYQCDNNDSGCSGGNYVEYVSLSGTDVSGTTFCFINSTRIDFATNESGVYGGFYIQTDLKTITTN